MIYLRVVCFATALCKSLAQLWRQSATQASLFCATCERRLRRNKTRIAKIKKTLLSSAQICLLLSKLTKNCKLQLFCTVNAKERTKRTLQSAKLFAFVCLLFAELPSCRERKSIKNWRLLFSRKQHCRVSGKARFAICNWQDDKRYSNYNKLLINQRGLQTRNFVCSNQQTSQQ